VWAFWQESQKALENLGVLHQQLAAEITRENTAGGLPHGLVKDVKRNIAKFSESFACMIHAVKQQGRR
jgi:hypothetical protein